MIISHNNEESCTFQKIAGVRKVKLNTNGHVDLKNTDFYKKS